MAIAVALTGTWHIAAALIGVAALAGLVLPARPMPMWSGGRAIDSDTIEIHGQRLRLHGIDAPESDQLCIGAVGQRWRSGQQAAPAPQDLIGRRTVTCDERDVDRHGRMVGRCLVGGLDVNEWLGAQDLALAYRRYSRDYVAVEEEAQAARRGMWAGTFEPPWEWRRRR